VPRNLDIANMTEEELDNIQDIYPDGHSLYVFRMRNAIMLNRTLEILQDGAKVFLLNVGLAHLNSNYDDSIKNKEVSSVIDLLKEENKKTQSLDIKEIVIPIVYDKSKSGEEYSKMINFVENDKFKGHNHVFGNTKEEIATNVNEYLRSIGLKVEPLKKVEKEDDLGFVDKKETTNPYSNNSQYLKPYEKPQNWKMKAEEMPSENLTQLGKLEKQKEEAKGRGK
jgi:hypothetical protein